MTICNQKLNIMSNRTSTVFPLYGALRFMAGAISQMSGWVCFSPNDMSRLRRLKNVKFGTKVGSSKRMMCTLRFLGKVFLK